LKVNSCFLIDITEKNDKIIMNTAKNKIPAEADTYLVINKPIVLKISAMEIKKQDLFKSLYLSRFSKVVVLASESIAPSKKGIAKIN